MKEYRPKKSRRSTISTLVITQVIFAIVLYLNFPSFAGLPLWILICWILLFMITMTAIVKTARNKPTFIVGEAGIVDNVGFNSCGAVPWRNIKAIVWRKGGNMNFICLDLVDEMEILNKAGFLKRIVMKSNKRRLGTICVIPEAALNDNPDAVMVEIDKYFQRSMSA